MDAAASTSYSLFVLFLLLVDIVLIRKLSCTPGFGREESWIVKLVTAAALTALSDALCVGIGAAAGFWGNYLFNFTFDLATGYIAYFFFCYWGVRFESRVMADRRLFALFTVPVVVLVFALVASLWTGWIFHIEPDGTYVRGPLFGVFVFVLANGYTVGAILLSVVCYLRKRTPARRKMLIDCVKYVVPLVAGTVLQFYFTSIPSSNMGMTLCVMLVCMDNQERLLQRKTLDAEAANAAKSEFLSRMSHDVRTPINGIVGMIGIARENMEDTARVRDCLEKISGAANQLHAMVSDVLDMSKIETEGLDLTHEPFNLTEMMHGIDGLPQSLAAGKGVAVELVDASVLQHPWVVGSPVHVRSVAVNLVSNAVKYTDTGGTVKCSIREVPWSEARTVRGLQAPEGEAVFVEFVVSDTGIGMSRDFAKRVFEPFTQERTDGRTTYKGSGLGLAIVKKIVDAMGGVIRLDTELGKGSTFTVLLPFECATQAQIRAAQAGRAELPDAAGQSAPSDAPFAAGGEEAEPGRDALAEGEAGSASTASAAASAGHSPASAASDASAAAPASGSLQAGGIAGMRILLVEDNALNAEIAQYLLEEAGASVALATDGFEALETFDGNPVGSFDVVLMDVLMPRMDGLEATRRIRSLARADAGEVPIIGMSANAFSDDVAAAKEAGMDDYVVKPINRERLLAALAGKART